MKSAFMLQDEDIVIIVNYHIEIPFLKNIIKPIAMEQSVCVRAFTGNENFESFYEKDDEKTLGSDEDQVVVYITKNGQVYHEDRACRYIDVKVKSISYGQVMDKSLCTICSKDVVSLEQDTIVYSTDKSHLFHTSKACWTISRDISAVSKSEAIENGYPVCSLCKGEGNE